MPNKPTTANTQDLAETEYDAERWAQVGTEQRSAPSISPKVPSEPARTSEADLTQEERVAGQRAGQKRIGEAGLPSA